MFYGKVFSETFYKILMHIKNIMKNEKIHTHGIKVELLQISKQLFSTAPIEKQVW